MMLNEITTQPSGFVQMEVDEVSRFTFVNGHNDASELTHFTVESYSKNKASRASWVESYLSHDKERLYVRFIRNLFKKLDFMELAQSLEAGEISDDDFERELDEHEYRYLIESPVRKPTRRQVIQTADIIKKIGRVSDMSVGEVSELFSLDFESYAKEMATADAMHTLEGQ